jgi:squalene-associated FAD-dependent desaturase
MSGPVRTPQVHVVGAGLAGLSAAAALAEAGVKVVVWEGAAQAGGRCRSYYDPVLEHVIDNGNHLILAGNHAVMRYARMIGSQDALVGPERPITSFVDIVSGRRWAIKPNLGAVPTWLFDKTRRVPDTTPVDYLELVKILVARPDQTLGQVLTSKGPLWERLLHPFFLSALNTQPEGASARLAAALVRETFAKGGRAYRTRIAHPTLAAAFVNPALAFIAARGGEVRLGRRVRALRFEGDRVAGLETPDQSVQLGPEDKLIVAAPPWSATQLIPDLTAPNEFRAIVNAHFMTPGPAAAPGMLGVIGGVAEWVFSFPDRISVTISDADAIVDRGREDLAETLWADVQRALDLTSPMPEWQIVKERRATFAATVRQDARRPDARTRWRNLILAGDWVQTGLPATIEGALRSGFRAAVLAGGADLG